MSNDRTSPKHWQDPANATQICRSIGKQRDFYDIALRFVGKSTKQHSTPFYAPEARFLL
jgi:hypothetical protein